MYSSQIVEQRLEIATEELGFRPEYHSPSEIDTFNAQLERKYSDAYAAARSAAHGSKEAPQVFQSTLYKALCDREDPKLSSDEVRFMQSEKSLVACDAAYFMTRHYRIKNRENNLQRFTFQQAQKVLFDVTATLEDLHAAIEILDIKARQLGVSTEAIGMGLHKVAFDFGVSGIIASAARDKTEDMVAKMFLAYDLMDWWLRPAYTKRVNSAKGSFVFGGSRADIRFQHGNQMDGIARGGTPIFYLLSEAASYTSPELLIEAALFKCVHPSPRVLGFIESTCEGNTGWLYDTYWYSKNNWPRTRLKTIFLPFYLEPEMYPNDIWLRKNPIPEKWKMEMATRQMIAESHMYVASDPVLQKVLGKEWRVPERVAWYWQCEYQEACAKGKEKLFLQELPHTDKAAFQGSYDSVFGKDCIAEVWSSRETKYHVYGIVGQSIEARHEPDPNEVVYDGPDSLRVPVKYQSKRDDVYRWEFLPLNWVEPFDDLEKIRDDESHMGKLFVYLEPERGYDYSIGVDTGNGLSQDGSAVAVCRRARNESEQDIQVAEWRDNRVSHVEAWSWVLAIAAYYSRYMDQGFVSYTEPYVAVEQILAVGDTCQDQMALHGYHRFHRMIRYDSMPKDMRKSKSRKRGWFTNMWSRPMLCDGFVINVQNKWYRVNSPYTIWEMDHWEVHYTGSGKDKFEHSEDTTDDGLFANALASFCPNDRKKQSERTLSQWRGDIGKKGPKLSIEPIKPGLEILV